MATSPRRMTAGEAEMLQEAKDKKAAPKLERAYNQSLTNTAPAPADKPKPVPAKSLSVGEAEMLQEAKDRKMAPKLERAYNQSLTSTEEKKAKGGVTRPTSKNRYKEIRDDEFMAGSRSFGQGPANAYKRLQEASASGEYASPSLNRGEAEDQIPAGDLGQFFKKGGVVSASRRADGIAQRGKTRGKMV
jgi:hypothetical protein